jgi:hypothetical protein
VNCVPRPGASHSISDSDILDVRSHRNYRARAAVTKRRRLIEPALHGSKRRHKSIATKLPDYIANQVWPGFCLLKKIFSGELGGCAFRSRRDKRRSNSNQDRSRQKFGQRHVRDFDLAASRILENLSHAEAATGDSCQE